MLDLRVGLPWFRNVCGRLEQTDPLAVMRMEGVLYGRGLEQSARELAARSRALRKASKAREVSFEGVYAWTGHGLRSHFDSSDALIIQQTGTQEVRLCTPGALTPKELKDRVLGAPGAGLAEMPDDCERFVLEPGDALYVPLFWPHWGVAQGGSSLSLAAIFGSETPIDLLVPLIGDALKAYPRWWMPLPQRPGPSDEVPEPETLELFFNELLDALRSEEFRSNVKQRWWREIFNPPSPTQDLAGPYLRVHREVDSVALGIDFEGLGIRLEAARAAVDPAALMGPSMQSDAAQNLVALRSVHALLRHAKALERAASIFEESTHIRAIAEQLKQRQSMAPQELRSIATPRYTSWLWRLEEAIEFGNLRHFDAIAEEMEDALKLGQTGPLVRSNDRVLQERFPKGGRFDAPKLATSMSSEALEALTLRVERANGKIARRWAEGAQVLSRLVTAVLPVAEGERVVTRVVPHFLGVIALEQTDDQSTLLALASALGRTLALSAMEAQLVFQEPLPFEAGTARLFEDVSARAHRYLYSQRVGIELPQGYREELARMHEAVRQSGQLTAQGATLLQALWPQ